MVQALMLLRSKKLTDPISTLTLFFQLFKARDKSLRKMLFRYIISDVKNSNSKTKNNRLNKTLQNFMFNMINNGKDANPGNDNSTEALDIAAKYSLDICIELYRKNIWNDSKTVNIIAECCFSEHNKVLTAALKFFLGNDIDDANESEEESNDSLPDLRQMQFKQNITKKSKSAQAKLDKAKRIIQKREKKQINAENFNFSALHLINDPQTLAEKLFQRLNYGSSSKKSKDLKFEIRIMIMNLISRLIGLHKLVLLNFYPYLVRYLKPHQDQVTQILAISAQATHDLLPPDVIESLLRSIIDNFVTDAVSSEVNIVGLNSVREICSRNYFALSEDILAYICTFKVHRIKGVSMAAKSIISLYRTVYPELLPKKERGKIATMEISRGQSKAINFGDVEIKEGVEGTEMLSAIIQDENEAWNIATENSDYDSNDELVDNQNTENSESDDDKSLNEVENLKKSLKKEKHTSLRLGLQLHDFSVPNNVDNIEEDLPSSPKSRKKRKIESIERHQTNNLRIDAQRILTPADFAALKKLKMERDASRLVNPKKDRADASEEKKSNLNLVDVVDIYGDQKKKKQSKDERIQSIMEGRKDRPKYGSRKGKLEHGSTTNKQKAKNKNIMMIVHKRSVKAKKKMSLRDKQKRLRKHIDHVKRQK